MSFIKLIHSQLLLVVGVKFAEAEVEVVRVENAVDAFGGGLLAIEGYSQVRHLWVGLVAVIALKHFPIFF